MLGLLLLVSAAVAVTTVQECDNVAVGAPMSLVLNCSNLSPVFTLNFSGLAQSQAVDDCIPVLSVVDTAAGGLVLRCEGDAGNHCFAVEVFFAVSLNSTSGNLVTIERLPENVNVMVKYNQTSPLNLTGGTGSLVYVTAADPRSCKVRVALEGTQLVMSSRSTVIIAYGMLVDAVLILNSTGASGAGTLITVYGPASDILVIAHNTTVVGGIRAVASNYYPISNVSSYLLESYFELYDSRWIASRDSDVDNVSITAVNCVLVFTQSEWIFGGGNVNRSSFALNNSTARSPKDGKLVLSKQILSNSSVFVADSDVTGTGSLRLLQSFNDDLSSLVNCTVTIQRSSIELRASFVVDCDKGILSHVVVVVIDSNVSVDASSFLVVAGGVISHIHLLVHQSSLSFSNFSSVVSTKDSAAGIELIVSSATLTLTLSSSFCSVLVGLTSVSIDIHSSQLVMQSLSSSFASFSVSDVSFTIDGSQILLTNNATLLSGILTLRTADITVRDTAITTIFSNIVSAPSLSLLSLHFLSTNLSIDFAPTGGWLVLSGVASSAGVPSAVEMDSVAIRWGGSSPVPVPVWPEPSVVTLVGCANTICAPPSPSSACRSTRLLRFCDFENKSATVFEASPASSACASQARCPAGTVPRADNATSALLPILAATSYSAAVAALLGAATGGAADSVGLLLIVGVDCSAAGKGTSNTLLDFMPWWAPPAAFGSVVALHALAAFRGDPRAVVSAVLSAEPLPSVLGPNRLMFPSLSLGVMGTLMPLMVSRGVRGMGGSAGDIASGVASMLLCCAGLGALVYVLRRCVLGCVVFSPFAARPGPPPFDKVLYSAGNYAPRERRSAFGALFAKMDPRFVHLRLVETAVGVCCGVLTGAASANGASREACRGLMATLATVYGVDAVAVAAARPFRLPSDVVLTPASLATLCALSVLKALAIGRDAAAVQALAVVQVIVSVALLALSTWVRFREARFVTASTSSTGREKITFRPQLVSAQSLPLVFSNQEAALQHLVNAICRGG